MRGKEESFPEDWLMTSLCRAELSWESLRPRTVRAPSAAGWRAGHAALSWGGPAGREKLSSTKSLEPKQSQTRRWKTFQYRPTAVDTQGQSVVLNHVPEYKHKDSLSWWSCPCLSDSRAGKSCGGNAWVGKRGAYGRGNRKGSR